MRVPLVGIFTVVLAAIVVGCQPKSGAQPVTTARPSKIERIDAVPDVPATAPAPSPPASPSPPSPVAASERTMLEVRPSALRPGSAVTIHLRRDWLGMAADVPMGPGFNGIGGREARVGGTVKSADERFVVLSAEGDAPERWVPVEAVLMIDVVPGP